MSTLSQYDALDPNGPLYYAPRNVRGGYIDPQSIRLQPDSTRQADFEPSSPPPKPLNPACVEDELPEAFRRLVENEFKSYSRRVARRSAWRRFAFAVVASLGAGAGIALGIAPAGKSSVQEVGPPNLAVEDGSTTANMPLPLGVSVTNTTPEATVELNGLPAGAVVSAGTAPAAGLWRLNVDELPTALVTPPQNYIGAMELVAEVQTADGQTLASEPLRLSWRAAPDAAPGETAKLQSHADSAFALASVSPSTKVREIDPAEVAALLQRAEKLMSNGDLPAARLLLQRLSEARNARAAYDLATTYDPTVIEALGVVTAAPDLALARKWYERARDWGAVDATAKLDALASVAQAR
jgi:hypothetical protein